MTQLTATCKNCQQPIYAGGGMPDASLGWLHQETGGADCPRPKPARAEPNIEGIRTCADCGAEMQATIKVDLSDVVLSPTGQIIDYRIIINGDDSIAAGLSLKDAIDNAIDASIGSDDLHIYCENDHDFPGEFTEDDPRHSSDCPRAILTSAECLCPAQNAARYTQGSARLSLLLAVILIACAILVGCAARGSSLQTLESAAIESPTPSPTPKAVYLCGAPTKAGGTCKRHVKNPCARCWMHPNAPPKEDCYYVDGDVTRPIEGKP